VTITHDDLTELVGSATDRLGFWVSFLSRLEPQHVAEIGVFRGAFAEELLNRVPSISAYYMVDPWRHLDDWNKPANRDDPEFERIFERAMSRTEEHAHKRQVLRGRTVEVLDKIADEQLDFLYIDGDHTLRGITIDLVNGFGKVRPNGWVGGDDFTRTIWQHGQDFEPTMVFPFAVYFAEAVGCPVYALPYRQFLIEKSPEKGFAFIDLTGSYPSPDLLSQLKKAAKGRARRGGKG
jgi:hypothetical protein